MSVDRVIEAMLAESERRHAWIYAAGEQIRRWREEEQSPRDGSEDRNSLPTNQ
jgi:hypothetical protein